MKLDDTPEMRVALVDKTIEAKVARRAHLELLDAAAAKGAEVTDVRQRLQRQLAAAGG